MRSESLQLFRSHWPFIVAGFPWAIGAAALLSHVFAGPMPGDMVHYLPEGTVRAIYLLASGVLLASLSIPALVGIGCLHGFRRRISIPIASDATFLVLASAALSPAVGLWLFAVGLITTSLWVFVAWMARTE